MKVFKQRLLNVARAVRESPAPSRFDMGVELHPCGTPSCAWGHYIVRRDLQQEFIPIMDGPMRGCVTVGSDALQYNCFGSAAQKHFGLSENEIRELFSPFGCGGAGNNLFKAVTYIEGFAERKWPTPVVVLPNWNALASEPLPVAERTAQV